MKRILIIDDDDTIRDVLTIILKDEGYLVESDSKGDYFKKQHSTLPDLVLLDLLLSGTNGRQICKTIKQNPKTKHIPVIIISAHTEKEVEKAAKEAGANGFLTKPFDIHVLTQTIADFCR